MLPEALSEEGTATNKAKISARLLRDPPFLRLNLDDAVTVLRKISFSSSKDKFSYTKSVLDNVISQKVQRALHSVQTNAGYPGTGIRGPLKITRFYNSSSRRGSTQAEKES